jgi:DHA1 family multidrug resistance protein-like MFS transporter
VRRLSTRASLPPVAWRRNLFAATAASFIGFTGFTLVMPFLPIYISELGVTDVGMVGVWTGLSLGVTPALTALLAPAWGRVADRFGRKLMVERSLLSFVVVMAAMAFVTRAWHVFALRALQGFFAGYGALTLAMAAESAPPERAASAIGLVQTAQRLGPAVGPVVGAALASLVGLRQTFLVTAAVYVGAFALVLLMYREADRPGRDAAAVASRVRLMDLMRLPNFALLCGVLFGIQFVDRSFGPILPLYLEKTGVPAARVPMVAGVLFSVLAVSAAGGHHLCGRLLRRFSARAVISGGSACAAAGAAAFAVVSDPLGMSVAFVAFGVGVGAAMTAAYAAAAAVTPRSVHATAFGLLTSAALAGFALSPVASGLMSIRSYGLVFLVNVIVLVIVAGIVRRVMVDGPTDARVPVIEDA